MRKAPLLLLAMTGIVSIPDAEAANRDKSWEFGAGVNYVDGATSGPAASDPSEFEPQVDNAGGYGLRVGYHVTAKSEVEFLVQMNSTDVGGRDADFLRASFGVVGNFLTDLDGSTIPYLTAGLGIIQETRDAVTVEGVEVLEAFDASTVLTIGFGARTFFNENWGIRYEARYYHHDNFDESQDEYVVDVGVTWILGGQQ